MLYKKYLVLLIALLNLPIACRNTTEEQTLIHLDTTKATQLPLDSMIQIITAMTLDSRSNAFLPNIHCIAFVKDRIYILERGEMALLKIFDEHGNFLFNVGRIGEAPGEYRGAIAFDIDEEANELIVYEGFKRAMITYDLNGHFKNETKIPILPAHFALTDDKMEYIFNIPNGNINDLTRNNAIVILDKKTNQINKAFRPFPLWSKMNYSMTGFFSKYKGNVLYNSNFSDTIFTINKQKYLPKYVVNLGSQKLDMTKYQDDQSVLMSLREHTFLAENGAENQAAFLFSFLKQEPTGLMFNIGIYDKIKKHFVVSSRNNGLIQQLFSPPFLLAIKDDSTFAAFISYETLLRIKENMKKDENLQKSLQNNPKLRQAIESATPKDNFTLIFFKLKNRYG